MRRQVVSVAIFQKDAAARFYLGQGGDVYTFDERGSGNGRWKNCSLNEWCGQLRRF